MTFWYSIRHQDSEVLHKRSIFKRIYLWQLKKLFTRLLKSDKFQHIYLDRCWEQCVRSKAICTIAENSTTTVCPTIKLPTRYCSLLWKYHCLYMNLDVRILFPVLDLYCPGPKPSWRYHKFMAGISANLCLPILLI